MPRVSRFVSFFHAPRPDQTSFPLAEADRCVLCGLCLPHCPTYRMTQDENESPRGRISLMRAIATGTFPMGEQIAKHLSLCLACRACEQTCPSGVRYGELIEAGRAQVRSRQDLPWLARLGLALMARPRLLEKLGSVLRHYQVSGLQRLVRGNGALRWLGLRRLEALLPAVPGTQDWQTFYPARGVKRGRVALFLGCVARILDAPTLAIAVRLLTRFGYEVVVPAEQTCCGALHRDAGYAHTALALAARNLAIFHPTHDDIGEIDAIVSVASGCTGALADHNHAATMRADSYPPVVDINHFLAEQALPETLWLAPLAAKVVIHDPCSLRNALHAEHSVYSLLHRIPKLELIALPENHLCCGGAGAYPLRQPAMAERLRADKLMHLKQLQPAILVTANIGCALHLAAGVRTSGITTEIIHPIVLFEQQLRERTG